MCSQCVWAFISTIYNKCNRCFPSLLVTFPTQTLWPRTNVCKIDLACWEVLPGVSSSCTNSELILSVSNKRPVTSSSVVLKLLSFIQVVKQTHCNCWLAKRISSASTNCAAQATQVTFTTHTHGVSLTARYNPMLAPTCEVRKPLRKYRWEIYCAR